MITSWKLVRLDFFNYILMFNIICSTNHRTIYKCVIRMANNRDRAIVLYFDRIDALLQCTRRAHQTAL